MFLFPEVDVGGLREVRGFCEADVVFFDDLIVNLCRVLNEMVEEVTWLHAIVLIDAMFQLGVVGWIDCFEDEVAYELLHHFNCFDGLLSFDEGCYLSLLVVFVCSSWEVGVIPFRIWDHKSFACFDQI